MEAKKSKFSFIIQPKDHTRKSGNFDNFGNLTFQGKKEFWWDIDLHIQEFYQSRDLNLLHPWLGNFQSHSTRVHSGSSHNRPSGMHEWNSACHTTPASLSAHALPRQHTTSYASQKPQSSVNWGEAGHCSAQHFRK